MGAAHHTLPPTPSLTAPPHPPSHLSLPRLSLPHHTLPHLSLPHLPRSLTCPSPPRSLPRSPPPSLTCPSLAPSLPRSLPPLPRSLPSLPRPIPPRQPSSRPLPSSPALVPRPRPRPRPPPSSSARTSTPGPASGSTTSRMLSRRPPRRPARASSAVTRCTCSTRLPARGRASLRGGGGSGRHVPGGHVTRHGAACPAAPTPRTHRHRTRPHRHRTFLAPACRRTRVCRARGF